MKLTRLTDFLNKMFSLKKISFYKLGLRYLPEGLGGLTSLEELSIKNFPSLVSIPSIRGLRSLRSLEIHICYNLDGSLEGLEAYMKLESLSIANCCSIRFEDVFPGC